ncbi:class I SAM-dependent DNA methyltransferase [Micromonospora sp. CA-248089]|uniref:class I SAM-dependent DNA methyltransferase n=1 Tax=Micromonospora sp. CA-248089 TaxID=3239960 RepID=UPI003D906E6A
MTDADKAQYWDQWAEHYDDQWRQVDPTDAVTFLHAQASGGTALELGVGTGRVAVPLAEKGLHIDAVELSPGMAQKLQDKAGSLPIRVVMGDMTDPPVQGPYELVYCVFNTFMELTTQELQLRCFENVSRLLQPGGRFVLETMMPSGGKLMESRQQLAIRELSSSHLSISALLHDPAQQRIEFQEVHIDENGIRLLPVSERYVWPSELDLMAKLAGLQKVSRTSNWLGGRFDGASRSAISVFCKPVNRESPS